MKNWSLADLPGTLPQMVVVSEQGCWLWRKHVPPPGYVTALVNGKSGRAHRLVYAAIVGPIPGGMHIDHTCHNRDAQCPGGGTCLHRRCLNPAHLEPVTPRINSLRSALSAAGSKARQDQCKRGHEFDDLNTQIRFDGAGRLHRRCRQCQRDRQRDEYWRGRAA